MRRDTEATWQSPCGPRDAQVALTRGRRLRGHLGGATRGIGGFAYEGPTGIAGPGKKLGAVTQMRYRAPIFKHTGNLYFFRVGLCPTRLTFCR